MSDAIMSFIGGWWARWFSRAGHAPAPTLEATSIPVQKETPEPAIETVVAAVLADLGDAAVEAPAADPEGIDEAAIEESFRETVGMGEDDVTPDFTRTPFSLEPRVRLSTIAALEQLKQIPALQSLVQGVVQIMGRDGVSVDEVVEALEKDSALCVRVLTMSNSVAISPEQRIVDLQTAVQMLGINRVRRVAQAVFTMRGAQRMAEGLDWRHLWIHALATAAIAEELDRRVSAHPNPQIYIAGLLHDLGKIVLSTATGEAYRDLIVSSWNGQGRLEDLERDRLGVNHREAGVIFARKQRLSPVVIEVVAHHGAPEGAESFKSEVAIVSIANFMSKARGLGFSGARLDGSDGDLENLPAWRILSAELGREINIPQLELDMADFFSVLRADLKGLREAVK